MTLALTNAWTQALTALRDISVESVDEIDAVSKRALEIGASLAHARDFWIASAAALGNNVAIRFLDEALFDLGAAVRRIGPTAEFQNELKQRVRVRLLVAEAGEVPRIAKYSGRGPLRAWLRVTATRVALDMRRAERPRTSDTQLADLWSTEPDS